MLGRPIRRAADHLALPCGASLCSRGSLEPPRGGRTTRECAGKDRISTLVLGHGEHAWPNRPEGASSRRPDGAFSSAFLCSDPRSPRACLRCLPVSKDWPRDKIGRGPTAPARASGPCSLARRRVVSEPERKLGREEDRVSLRRSEVVEIGVEVRGPVHVMAFDLPDHTLRDVESK